MFRKGHRLFSAAAICLILIAAMHVVSFFAPSADDVLLSALTAAMRGYRFDMGPGRPSMMDIFDSLSLTFALMMLWAGVNSLMVARHAEFRGKLVRRTCTLNLIFVGFIIVVYAWYEVVPPALTLAVAWLLFFVARFRLRRSRMLGPVTPVDQAASPR